MFLEQFELSATIMTNYSPDHNTSASKTAGRIHTRARKRSPWYSSLKRMCCQVWSLQGRCVRAEANLAGLVLWRCIRIDPTTGRLARSPESRSLLRTVWPEMCMFARSDVLRAVASAVIIRFQRRIRRKCLSWRCDVTRGLPLRGLSFDLPVCRRRIISLEIVILETLKWSATTWWVIPAWTIPTARSRSF
jgi:hypothetical protein